MRNKNRLDKALKEEELRIIHQCDKEIISLKHAINTRLLRWLCYCIVPFLFIFITLAIVVYIKNNNWCTTYEHLKYIASAALSAIGAVITDRYFAKR